MHSVWNRTRCVCVCERERERERERKNILSCGCASAGPEMYWLLQEVESDVSQRFLSWMASPPTVKAVRGGGLVGWRRRFDTGEVTSSRKHDRLREREKRSEKTERHNTSGSVLEPRLNTASRLGFVSEQTTPLCGKSSKPSTLSTVSHLMSCTTIYPDTV